jgi:hypothetical protein
MADNDQQKSTASQYWQRMADRGREAREADVSTERTTERQISRDDAEGKRAEAQLSRARNSRGEMER